MAEPRYKEVNNQTKLKDINSKSQEKKCKQPVIFERCLLKSDPQVQLQVYRVSSVFGVKRETIAYIVNGFSQRMFITPHCKSCCQSRWIPLYQELGSTFLTTKNRTLQTLEAVHSLSLCPLILCSNLGYLLQRYLPQTNLSTLLWVFFPAFQCLLKI